MHFEFLKTQELTLAICREIDAFLDRQSNGHPFQFPNWMGAGKYCAIVREQGGICWFALCGVSFPVGKWPLPVHSFPVGKWPLPVRSLTINRGPVCDDADLILYGLGKLVEKSKELGFASVKIMPDWVERPGWTVRGALSRDGWESLPDPRCSLRLDLNPASEELLRSFRQIPRQSSSFRITHIA